VNNIAKGVQKI